MDDVPASRYQVQIDPEAHGFWNLLASARLSVIGEAGAEAVAAEQHAGSRVWPIPGGTIAIVDKTSGREVWSTKVADLTGGTSPDQLVTDIETDLQVLSEPAFVAKYGIEA
jgi:hypothetical protein